MSGTILITGATAGIGAATARRFAREGWKVVGTGRRRDRLDALAAELGAERFHGLALDMRDIDAIAPAVDALPQPFAAVDLLLNNAGLAPPMEPLQRAGLEPLRQVIDTNITGLVALTRALLPGIVERKGMVVNLSSVAATYPYAGGAVYGGSKAFVRQFSLDLRCDLPGTGVRVTSIEPGMAETEFTIVRTGGDKAASDALYADMDPMTAEDLAETVWWLASLPPHLNINTIELMPVSQSFAGFKVARKSAPGEA
jgi:serine 3-dehydrogenase (NADP+)